MLRACALTTPRHCVNSRRIKMQNKAQLILKLFGKPPSHKSVQDGIHHALTLAFANAAMLEAP